MDTQHIHTKSKGKQYHKDREFQQEPILTSTNNQATSTTPGQSLWHSGLSNQPTPSPFHTGYSVLWISYPQLVSTLSFLLHLHFLSLFLLTNFKSCVDSHYHHMLTTIHQQLPPPHAKCQQLTITAGHYDHDHSHHHAQPLSNTSTTMAPQ